MNNFKISHVMKATAFIIATALFAPAAILLGASAAAVTGATTVIGLSAIALSDYSKTTVTYDTAPAKRTERHPLAA